MSVELWTQKYRPKTLDEYVWQDGNLRRKTEEWIKDGVVSNLLLAGAPGTGKTSLAYLLLDLLEVPAGDRLFIPASKERKIEDIQNKISNFSNTWALGPSGVKVVILDECDAITPVAQKFLRTEMETLSDMTRYIATCNYPQKIIPALLSRFNLVNFQTMDQNAFVVRVCEVLIAEDVQFEPEVIDTYVAAAFPDLRRCLNLLQHNTIGGVLHAPAGDTGSSADYVLACVDLFKSGKFLEARKLIVSQAAVEEYPDIFKMLYRNLVWFGTTQEQQNAALLKVRDAVVSFPLVGDPEILLAALLVELSGIAEG